MLDLRLVGPLLLARPTRGRGHVAAASGLVCGGGRAYVVSDDDFAIAVFEKGSNEGGLEVALATSDLPPEAGRRKALKPDLEALASVPFGRGTLLALGSGATPQRERGWLLQFGDEQLPGTPVELSLSDLYRSLREQLDDLNVEGAAVAGEALWLAQRGNGAAGANALVELSLAEVLSGLERERALPASALRGLRKYELGDVEGVPLTFTDLAPLPDGRLLFCAVAEEGESTYEDGACVGSAVGLLDPAGEVLALDQLPEPHKVEGVAPLGPAAGGLELLLVADPDDPEVPSPLFRARLLPAGP